MRLFIAEKPELAKAIVEALGGGNRMQGFFECGPDAVTWCYGHMLELLDPEDYDARFGKWNMADLPIAHIPWRKKVSSGKEDQVKLILGLLKKADKVVHAGDPDAEGQLLVDEVLAHANYRGPVSRVLINDNNTALVQKAMAAMKDNRDFAGLSASAEARGVADQLYGYNMTRCWTLAARQAGYAGMLSVGRVQTPIVGLVVRRDREHAAHQKAFYYVVNGQFVFPGGSFAARYQIEEGDPVDDKGRLSDEAHAQARAAAASGQPARVVSAVTSPKETPPPLPYNLLKLQADASRLHGLKPDEVKTITQTLREKYRLITYNRSDCQYLNEEHHGAAPEVLQAVSDNGEGMAEIVAKANPALKSRTFDSSKVGAHHAIIPTVARANLAALTKDERAVYLMIARRYVAQFFLKHLYDHTEILIEVAGHRFLSRTNHTTHNGWRVLFPGQAGETEREADETPEADLRGVKAGEEGTCTEARAQRMETKPPPLYTMATLLTDLTRVSKYIKDERIKKLLLEKDKGKEGEHGGIGTPATRDSIIKTLFTRGYLVEQGKNIVSTETAREFYDALPDQAKFPDMTALWHEQQQSIAQGEREAIGFIQELMEYIGGQVREVREHGLSLKIDFLPCPECGKPLRRAKGAHGFFWSCTGYPECKHSCPDKGGKPAPRVLSKELCPKCQKPLRQVKGQKGPFWSCTGYPACAYSCPDKEGKPVPKVAAAVSGQVCQACGRGLVRRERAKQPGSFWWGCSGYPACKETYNDGAGKPIYPVANPETQSHE